MAEILNESPVKRPSVNAKWDEFYFDLECPCPGCPRSPQKHKVTINRLKGWGRMVRVKGMLQVIRDVNVTQQDAILFALDVAAERLEERIRKELAK